MKESLNKQIARLANFIEFEATGEPNRGQGGVVDTILRLLKDRNELIGLLEKIARAPHNSNFDSDIEITIPFALWRKIAKNMGSREL